MELWAIPIIAVGTLLLFFTSLALGEVNPDSKLATTMLFIFVVIIFASVFFYTLVAFSGITTLVVAIFYWVIIYSSTRLGEKLRELKDLEKNKE